MQYLHNLYLFFAGVDEVVNAERAEALLYLASYYKEQGFLTQAELLCSR
jgi:hypothetical protein